MRRLPQPFLRVLALLRLAQLYSAATRRDDALAQLKRATEIDPKIAPAYRVLGEGQVARGDLTPALEATI